MRLEALEERRLLAVGPELVAVQANDGTLLRDGSVQNVAARDLTFRFDEGQVIDPASLAAIQITRQPDDPTAPAEVVKPGFVGIGDTPNEVIVRFAETLEDGVYTVNISSRRNPLVNTNGDRYENVGRLRTPFTFDLNLGAQVVAVVPQPVERSTTGALTQRRDQIVVYFNDDDLHASAVSTDPTATTQPSVVDPRFYRLIFTNDTITNEDGGPGGDSQGTVFNPTRIDYDPATDTAVLTFASPIDQLSTGAGTYRLRIGTDEALPAAPVIASASATVRHDFNTNHQVEILLTPDVSVAARPIAVEVSKAAIAGTADPADPNSYIPDISVSGRTIEVTLKSANLSDPNARGTTAAQLVAALNNHASAKNLLTAQIAGGGAETNLASRTIDYSPVLLADAASSFDAALNVTDVPQDVRDGVFRETASAFDFSFAPGADGRATSIVISSAIDKQPFPLPFPGAMDEPGHRDIPVERHFQRLDAGLTFPPPFSPSNTASEQAGTDVADEFPGISTRAYNFRDEYGVNPGSGLPFINVISEAQKQRAREIFEIYGDLLGVQFVETEDQGIIVATGDLRAVNPLLASQPGGVAAVIGSNTLDGQLTVVLDNAENWSDQFGVDVNAQAGQLSWFEEAMEGIGKALGLGESHDLPPLTIQGENSSLGAGFQRADNSLPGDHDIVHGQHLYRPDAKDVDLYRFQVSEFGRFSAEIFAERLTVASHLDAVISLYREDGSGQRTLIARNDDYFSEDPHVEMDLTPGVYYVAVSASGNTSFDPENGDTGIGGTTDGEYDLRLGFRPQADATIVDIDATPAGLNDRQPLDGDGDGVPGGVFNYWFRALPPVNPAAPQNGGTIYVDKVAPGGASANGTLASPFAEIDQAIAFINRVRDPQRTPGANPNAQFVVRIAGNDGAANDPAAPLAQRLPYVLGRDPIQGQPLADGVDLEVPRGVTVMIDEGAVFKMRGSSIFVGSSLPTVDRSRAAVQVLGVPGNNVYFTSYDDEQIGTDTNPNPGAVQTPNPGDWGGIVFRNDVDRDAPGGRFDYEREGIFLNYVNQADLRYGGGQIALGSTVQVVTPVHMINARPTVTFNTITRSADAAMSANPDSFEESNFHDPASQRRAFDPQAGDRPFALDYRRVGPDIHGNRLALEEQTDPRDPDSIIVHSNTLNGLFVRIGTSAGEGVEKLTVAGRFDDADIVHILQENLEIQGQPGGLTVERYVPAPAPIPLARTAGGALPAGTYTYFVTFVDAAGVEGPRSPLSNASNVTGGPGQGTIQLRIQRPASGEFVQWRLYRSDTTGAGPFTLVAQEDAGVSLYNDNGTTLGGEYTGAAPAPQFETTVPGGTLSDGVYNYFVTFVDENGVEGPASPPSENIPINPGATERTIRVTIQQPSIGEFVRWRLYRSQSTGAGPYVLVSEQQAAAFAYNDDGDTNDAGEAAAGVEFRGSFVPVNRARPDARLKIDPSLIVKSEGARIEAAIGAQIIAEGLPGQEVVFTSLLDNRYGAGGVFDTAGRGVAAAPGNWGGVYLAHTSEGSFDNAVFAYGGGSTRVEGGFGSFNVLEVHQAQARITNSTFEFNGDGRRTLDPADDPDRVGRGVNAPGVIFIRAAQPIVVNNLIRQNAVTAANINPAVTINVNALNSDVVTDWGRTTVPVDYFTGNFENNEARRVQRGQEGPLGLFTEVLNNQGPLFRNNVLVNETVNVGAYNGMVVRGNVLTTESVWDDTDIVHVLLNEVLIPDFHTKGGLRLQSSASESLVVKLSGANAGFTANGQPLDIDDRIGGTFHALGQPGHPVVMTSLHDCTVGAGLDLSGRPQLDTANSGACKGQTGTVPYADVIVVMDESASMGPIQVFSQQFIVDLEAAFQAAGIGATAAGGNRYGLLGFGGAGAIENGHVVPVGPNNDPFGTSQEYVTAAQTLVANGATEDGYLAMDLMFQSYVTRPDAAKFVILATNEDRDVIDPSKTFATTLAGLQAGGFALQGILDVSIMDAAGAPALAMDAQRNVYQDDGMGGYTVSPNGQITDFPPFNTSVTDYADMAFATGGTVGDINIIGPDPQQAAVFSQILADSIVSQVGGSNARPGDWRGVQLQQFANDRNVAMALEREPANADAPGLNAVPENAEFLGELAPSERAGDDARRLGFEVHGFLADRHDIDVYSFLARTGTEVWFDIDNTTHSLDTVLELVDANGLVIARSDNSLDEQANPGLLFRNTNRIPAQHVNPLAKSDFQGRDHFSTNPRDAGMRLVLPGSANTVGTYHIRVRSANPNLNTPQDQILDGRSLGRYELQIRLRETDEVPGTTINGTTIRFATTAIDVEGLPLHSPLVGETAEDGTPNQFRVDAQDLGNLLETDRGAISVAGFLDANNPEDPVAPNPVPPEAFSDDPDDVDWYSFVLDYESLDPGEIITQGPGVVFDLDFADNLGRPNARISIFDEQGQLILSSDNSNVNDDVSGPLGGSGARDPARGSGGPLDPFLGPIQLPARRDDGTLIRYYVAVSHAADRPVELAVNAANPSNPLLRLEPVESVARIAEDHFNNTGRNFFGGFTTAQPQQPLTPLFVDANGDFVGELTPFDLSDVALFVNEGFGSQQSQLHIVDAFSGARETIVGRPGFATGDIAMRGDGNLFSFTLDLAGGDAPKDDDSGDFLLIDTATGVATIIQESVIQTFERDPADPNNIVRTHDVNGTRVGHGIQFNAMAFNRTASRLFAVGNRGNLYPGGADYAQNILYRFDPSDFDGDNTAPGLPDTPALTGGARVGRAGTNFLDQGRIPTDVDLFGGSDSVIVAPDATAIDNNGNTIFTVNDGDSFTVEVQDSTGATVASHRFEMNSGPEAVIDFDLANNEFFVDGEFFTLTGVTDPNTSAVSDYTFEFNTGVVLVPNGQFSTPGSYGETITITDNSPTPVTRTFEITDAPGNVSQGNVPVVVASGASQVAFVNAMVGAINNQFNQTPFNARAVLSNGRVTLLGDTAVRRSGANSGFNIFGDYTVRPGAQAVQIEENFTSSQIITAIQDLVNGLPASSNPPPGIPGLTAGAEGMRINFLGATSGDFDNTDNSANPPRTPRFMDGVPGTNGNVMPGSIAVPFLAGDTGEDIAQSIIDVTNNSNLSGGLMAQGSTPPGRAVTFTAPSPNMAIVTQFDDPPFSTGAPAPGGDVTGIAFLPETFGIGRMFAVSDGGGLYEVLDPEPAAPTIDNDAIVPTDFITTIQDPETGLNVSFSGLTVGPPNLQGGAFADTLFGISDTGRVYAFDTGGNLLPIFQDGQAFVDTGVFGANGLAFSTLDYNLWRRSLDDRNDPNNPDPFHFRDPGHGLEPTATGSRDNRVEGGQSLYFGSQLFDVSNQRRGLQGIDPDLDGQTDYVTLGQKAGNRRTYDFPGGAHGSTVSAPFSLKGYETADQPTLYFNYFLDTDGTDSDVDMRDSFRVFASADDPNLPADPTFRGNVIQGQWYLLATNNAATTPSGRLVEADSPFNVQVVHDNTGGWRQARIDLSPLAGLENVRLRFDFSTAGSMDTRSFFGTDTGGEELKIIPAAQLRDGQTFQIDGRTFEFDLGVTLAAPTGDAISDAETFAIDDDGSGPNLPVRFQLTNDNTFESDIRTRSGSFFSDGDTFTVTDPSGVTQAFEFDSGFSLVVPVEGARPAGASPRGIQDGDTFRIDDDSNLDNDPSDATPPVVFEFDMRDGIAPTSNVAIDVVTDVALLIPAAGGTPLTGVNDGDTFTIDDDGPGPNAPTLFEFDSNPAPGALDNPNAVRVPFNPSDDQDTLADKTAAAINAANLPGVSATHVGGGEVRLGSDTARIDSSGSPNVGQRNIPGSQLEIADRIVQAIQNYQANFRDLGVTPLHTTRNGARTGEVYLGGTEQTALDTSNAPTLRQRGEPGVDPAAIAVPFVPSDEPPPEGFTASEIAQAVAAAINQANAQGFGVTAAQDTTNPTAVRLTPVPAGGDFSFSPGSSALGPEGIVPIAFNKSQSAEEIAAAMAAAIANSTLNVTVHQVGHRINLEDNQPATQMIIQRTPGTGAALPSVTVEGLAGVEAGNEPVVIHSEMAVQQVRDAVAQSLTAAFAPAAAAEGINVFATHANTVRVQGHAIIDAGPLGATSFATRYLGSNAALQGDSVGVFNEDFNGPALRGVDNQHQGVFIDDIIVGFAERGEMVLGPGRADPGDDTFVYSGDRATVGAYQLEIRRASEYGVGQLTPVRSFDTNDRLSQSYTLFAPAGSQINPTSTFFISDGVDTVTFEYVNQSVPGAQPQAGNVAIFFSADDSAATVAQKIRNAINSQQVQQNLGLNVTAAAIAGSDRVTLAGDTVIVNVIKPGLTIDDVTTDGNALRNSLLGPGVTPVGDAVFLGGPVSAGFFSGGASSIGIDRGIVLSTGDINFAEGPNTADNSTEDASRLGDPNLDDEFGVVTTDTTFLQFDFELDASASRDLFFNFVFASEEYNEFVNSIFNDVFAFFVDGQNVALVPGTTTPVSINTVNGGFPFGTAATNPQAYRNNDPDENGQFLDRFGLDGFTTVFTAEALGLAPGVHTIKLAISDVGDLQFDSAVFIEAGSFSTERQERQVRNGIPGVRHNETGDENRQRDQGQLIIANNQILNSAGFGISVASAPRDPNTGFAAPGSPRNLEQLNQEGLVPGVVIRNNVVAHNQQGGLRFSGDPGGAGLPRAAVPHGRIVNNTFYGLGASGVGVLVENNAGPTLMNNIVANFGTGIQVDASSQPHTVIASTLYKSNGTDSNVGLGSNFPVVLGPNDPLFVDPAANNFYLAPGSQAIDSSIDSIQERSSLANVKASLGIPSSNILAPERDLLGQIRRDNPNFQPSFGAGQVVFKDRGAIDRVDFTGPTPTLAAPRDNDAEGLDQNPASFAVRTSGQLVRQFAIRLIDGLGSNNPSDGTGVDPATVDSSKITVEHFAPDDVGLTTPEVLEEFTDYTFSFNSLTDTITLTDVGGLFPPGFYRITLDNTPVDPDDRNDDGVEPIRDLAGNPLRPTTPSGAAVLLVEIPTNLDFGDAPQSYGVTVDPGSDGPRHTIRPNFFLGTQVDAELDGVPSPDAAADGADEDGVRIGGALLQGAGVNVGATVALEVLASASGRLDAWIDFNRDGVFDAAEKMADNLPLNSGFNTVSVDVPEVSPQDEATLLGTSFARFRFSSAGGLGPTGPALDGEVEDYQITLKRADSPWQNPSNNLDVNADMLVSTIDALLIVNDIRENRDLNANNGNVHFLHPTREEAQANNQLFVAPGRVPFVDVNGDSLASVADLQQVVSAIRDRTSASSAAVGEGEGESPLAQDALSGEGEYQESAGRDDSTGGAVLAAPQRRAASSPPAEENEQAASQPSSPFDKELVLANSSFRTFEFEAALEDLAGDVSDAWSSDHDGIGALDDYFPFADVAESQKPN